MSATVEVGPVDAPLEIVDPALEVVAEGSLPAEETTEEVRSSLMTT
jgi:hypothetical protein